MSPEKILDIGFEEPFEDGYILIPKKIFKQCERLTKKFTISSNLPNFSTTENRQIKTLQSAVDYLKKNKKEITTESLGLLLNITKETVEVALNLAIELKYIEKVDDKYIMRFKEINKKEINAKIKKSLFNQAIAIFSTEYENADWNKLKKSPYFFAPDWGVLKMLLKKFNLVEFKDLVIKYFKLNDDFLKHNAYSLRFMSGSMNKILNPIDTKSGIIYTPEKYSSDIDEWQLKKYAIGKMKGKYLGTKPWEKTYIDEINKRGIGNNFTAEELKKYNDETIE